MLSSPEPIEYSLSNVERFISGEKKLRRRPLVTVWSYGANSQNSSEWMVGFGSGNLRQILEAWFPEGHVGRPFVKWNDYDS